MNGPYLTRRTLLASAALAGFLPGLAAAQTPWRPTYGWDADVRAPDTADIIVAPDGDDTAPGTVDAPLRTISAGVAALVRRGAGSLAIRGGTYRESVDLDALRGRADAPFRLHRFAAERVTITACERLEGWRPLSAAEAAAEGLPEGRVWRVQLPRDAVPGNTGPGLHLFEAGTWCPPATWRADRSDPARQRDQTTFWRARSVSVDDGGRLLEIRDPQLALIPPGALARAQVLVWRRPNIVSRMPARLTPDGMALDVSAAGFHAQKIDGAPGARYALQNLAAGMAEGHWMEGPGTTDRVLDVLYWPRSPEGPLGMEYGARETCVDFGAAAHVELLGLEAVGASGSDRYAGSAIRRRHGRPGGTGLTLRHCRAGDVQAFDIWGLGAIVMSDCTDLTIEHVTVEDTRNAFGLFVNKARAVAMSGLHMTGVSLSAGRFFGLRDAVLSFSLFEQGGTDAHANQFNFYEGCDRVLVYGVRTRKLGGYVTYQEASNVHFAFCDLEADQRGNGRILVSQNRHPGAGQGGPDGSGEPTPGSVFLYWNNNLQPVRPSPDQANSLMLGPEGSSQRHAFFNNFLHGGGVPHIYARNADPGMEARSHNRYSGTAYWQKDRYGWRLGLAETLGGAAALASLRGRDMRDVIAALAPEFPRFDRWNVDVDGTPIDWTVPPIGCRVF